MKSQGDKEVRFARLESEVRDLRSKLESSDFDHIIKVVTLFLKIVGILLGLGVILGGYNTFSILSFQKQIRGEIDRIVETEIKHAKKVLLMEEISLHVERAMRRMKSGSLADRDRAIWEDLHKPLKESRHLVYFDQIIWMYAKVLPHLNFHKSDVPFRESQRGEAWICVFLLESNVPQIVSAVRQTLPRPEKLRETLSAKARQIPKPIDRQDFRHSMEKLCSSLERLEKMEMSKDSAS